MSDVGLSNQVAIVTLTQENPALLSLSDESNPTITLTLLDDASINLQNQTIDLSVSQTTTSIELSATEGAVVTIYDVGLQGISSTAPHGSFDLTYVGGKLHRIDYEDGTYKTFTYSGGLLSQVDNVTAQLTQRNIFTYTSVTRSIST